MIDATGHVLVTDFGLAQPLDSAAASKDERLAGTLRYMSRERISGEQSAQSDIYSLGITIYELVTQTTAYDAPGREELLRVIMKETPTPPRAVNKLIPRPLEMIVLNAIAHDRAHRYQTARQLEADLVRFLNGKSVRSTKLGPLSRLRRKS